MSQDRLCLSLICPNPANVFRSKLHLPCQNRATMVSVRGKLTRNKVGYFIYEESFHLEYEALVYATIFPPLIPLELKL